MDLKKVGILLGIFFSVFSIFYLGVYIHAANTNTKDIKTNYVGVSDMMDVDPNLENTVGQYMYLYQLDSENRFNPKSDLTRIDAILLVDEIAKRTVPNYLTKKTTTVPYFDDFKSIDANSDAVLRVVDLIDTKDNFYKHYNILGDKLDRNKPINLKEFLTLLAVFLPVDKTLGDDYIIKNLSKYNIDLSVNLKSEISRQKSTIYVDKLMPIINTKE